MTAYQVGPDHWVPDAKQLIMKNLAEIGVLAGKLGLSYPASYKTFRNLINR